MAPQSLRAITLHETASLSFLKSEKDQAIRDLCDDAVFRPANTASPGPYDLSLSIQDGRLVLEMAEQDGTPLPALVLSVRPYTRLIRDYFMLIESYEKIRVTGTACQLEPIDMARRGLHNEGADLLIERLEGKIALDHPTARRLFTLICALHGQHFPVF
ncbi:MAG: UPF0262 family protein [Micavibrio aeruginosavorus]|nr:UPF0262 family protein [Micavibrio aeruginosavorus]